MEVAVLIPTYNRAGFLEQACQSLLNQTHDGNNNNFQRMIQRPEYAIESMLLEHAAQELRERR